MKPPLNILTLSQWYLPEPETRIHRLAHDLAARGHWVTSITGFPNYPKGKIYPGYRQRLWQWEQHDGVRVLRLPLYPDHSRSAIQRSLNYLSFAVSASLLGPVLSGSADVMWVYHPPLTVGIPAWWISLLRRMSFIYEVQDMWPETLLSTGMMTRGLGTRMLGRLAKWIYRQAAAIIVVSSGFKRNLIEKGVPAEKIHVIPNWADEKIYFPVSRDDALAKTEGMVGRFNIVFAGNMGPAQALENVLRAAVLLQDLHEVQFVLIGDGMDTANLRKEAQRRSLKNVKFIARQPADRMPHFYALADALLVHLKRDPLFKITIPSKTIPYLACGRPILAAVEGDAADMVKDAGAGLVCAPEDPAALAQTVRKLFAMPEAEREALGNAGLRAFLKDYSRQVLLDRYERLFMEVASKNGILI